MEVLRLRQVEAADHELGDDEALARRARLDRAAFGEFYVRHREAVFRYLRARAVDADDALDLTAVTFERALASIARYSGGGPGPRAWLLRIARNAAIDHHRRRRPMVRDSDPPVDRPSTDASPEEVAIASEEWRRIRGLLAQLPDLQRDAISLRFGAGMTSREIGAVLGKSEAATQKLISRALGRLKEAYRDDDR